VVLVVRALSGGGGGGGGDYGKGGGGAGAGGGGGHGITDEELYDRIVQGDSSNTFVRARAELLLQEARQFAGMQTPAECLAFIGSRFRLLSGMANSTTDVSIGHYIIHK
jgi:DNA-directed RNA polymerase I subunit RPA2